MDLTGVLARFLTGVLARLHARLSLFVSKLPLFVPFKTNAVKLFNPISIQLSGGVLPSLIIRPVV